MNKILDKILPYEAGADYVKYFVGFLGNRVSSRNAFEIYWRLDQETNLWNPKKMNTLYPKDVNIFFGFYW